MARCTLAAVAAAVGLGCSAGPQGVAGTGGGTSTANGSSGTSAAGPSSTTASTTGSTSATTSGATGGSGTTSGSSNAVTLHATTQQAPSSGWTILPITGASGPAQINDASFDEGGNLWIAAGTDGLYLLRAGTTSYQHFTLADGLHPYGYPTSGTITQKYLNVISVAGGAAGHAYVGYQGMPGCEDEWDLNASNPDPNVYKSGDVDHVWLNGSGIAVAHYDIYTGPNVVSSEPRGREKLCTIYRIAYDGAHGNVWVGANHGYAWLNPTWNGTPAYQGDDNPAVLQEHAHPAIDGYLTDSAPVTADYLLSGGYYGLAVQPNGDVWVGGIYRSYHCAGGDNGSNFWGCESDDNANRGHQLDLWPDPLSHDAYPRQRVDDYVTGLAVMADGSVWASARNREDDASVQAPLGSGLAHLAADGTVLAYLNEAMPSPHLTALAADPNDGSLWIGSESGVVRYDPASGVVYTFSSDAVGAHTTDFVGNIQVTGHGDSRKVAVAFGWGAVAIYTGP